MPLSKHDHALIEQLLKSRASGRAMENADLVEDIIETALRRYFDPTRLRQVRLLINPD